jgi:hypothetical protein
MAVMKPGSENTPSHYSLSIKRLDTKQGGLLERVNSIVQAAKFECRNDEPFGFFNGSD